MRSIPPTLLIFFIVVLDLIGFGIVIPLINIYGIHYDAGPMQLAILASAYSTMQFFFAPVWGALSDRVGRRPILLLSLVGSTLSYLLFGLANSYALLLAGRIFAGIFAANISAAQAYIADVTDRESRTRGMGLIGAAFGIGFTLGPPVGGITAKWYGLGFPGYLAACFSGVTLILAYFSLPESLKEQNRSTAPLRYRLPLLGEGWKILRGRATLIGLILVFFIATFAFSNFEQAFSPYLQAAYSLSTELAGYKAGILLMWLGIIGVMVQGFLVRRAVRWFGEWRLVVWGMALQAIGFGLMPFYPSYESFFVLGCLIPIGGGLANPALSALLSLNASQAEQGRVLGLAQGFSSLARVFGPACALLAFSFEIALPFFIGAGLYAVTAALVLSLWKKERP